MRSHFLISGILALFIMASCSPSNQLTNLKTNAENLEKAGNYEQAYQSWLDYLDKTPVEEVDGSDFARAANVAFNAGQTEQAVLWFDQARYKNYADAEMYIDLAKIYHNQDNLSKELSALEYYRENFGTANSEVNARLFAVYSEINELNKANTIWQYLSAAEQSKKENLVRFLEINKKLENDAVCDSVATAVLQMDPDQFEALDWMAKKYYWAGQNRYDREMKKYEQNKTRKQYNILLEELDKVTADFKKALPYLERLWEQKPGKEYAGYFANIYARFGDEQKVEYYKKYINN